MIILIICALPAIAEAQHLIAVRDSVENGYPFWLYMPAGNVSIVVKDSVAVVNNSATVANNNAVVTNNSAAAANNSAAAVNNSAAVVNDSIKTRKPLVIFLHGASLCGRNLYRVRRYGCIDAIEKGRTIDAYIIAPQNPGGRWNPEKILNILRWTEERYPVDTSRIYVAGMSLGGYGAIDFTGTYPEKVAAAMALCGGGTLSSYCGLNGVPLRIIHGTADRRVSVRQSQSVVDKMIACGDTSLLIFDRWQGANHSILARLFYAPETYRWLFSHSLSDSVRFVNRDITISPNTLRSAYRDLNRSATKLTETDTGKSLDKPYETDAEAVIHTVRKGDTLGAIARRYRTSVSKLCQMNNLKTTSILRIGQKIRVR
ncbi:MAG: LysM peptidoglycan-binding domain-containing protein [Tannerella sp.]|nr:LysM peptidoglycan-binding domain-containing protein [Tannerella sp.]